MEYQENEPKNYPGIDRALERWRLKKVVIPPEQRKIYEVLATTHQGKTFVDIGSSFGVGSNILSHRALGVWAIDKEQELIDFGTALFASPRLKFDIYDLLSPPNRPTATFDVVVMLEVLEHLVRDQWEAALSNIKRFFKEGTIGYISTPNRSAPELTGDHPQNELHTYEATAGEFYEMMTKHFRAVTLFSVPKLKEFAQEETCDGSTTETPLIARLEGGVI